MKRDFNNKVVAISGGGGGLGRAFGRRFALAGARVALLDLDTEAAMRAAEAIREQGGSAVGLGCDVTDPAQCAEALSTVREMWGRVDVMINNAGITHRSAFGRTDPSVFQRVMAVNYFGAIHCTQAALPDLIQGQGLIITISSVAGFSPLLGRTGYAGAKHALHGLFDSLRAELRPRGVDVLIVCPSFVDTAIAKSALGEDGQVTDHPQSHVGKPADPHQVAEAVFKAAERGRRLLILSAVGRLTWWMTRLYPALYERLMARSLRAELER
jgi:NAD(P)-dependent dehydrogenase (short-subunit alcohol dehydrogenase family)